ncbi:MAG: type II toxin-antitoxin system Phd/YefM family antitoxin [Acidobacteria bacterium]|nr:type II toxin-antitoxin system Phd/YefM family antitoxin [Acidobacteriota bacterium]
MRDEVVPVSEARSRLNDLLTNMLPTRNLLLVRHGRPVAVVISPRRYEALLDTLEDLADELSVLADRLGLEERVSLEKVAEDLRLTLSGRTRSATTRAS